MIEFEPNPIQLMIDVANEIKPDLKAKVYFTSKIPCEDQDQDAVGRTIFPNDGSIPHIQIHCGCTFEGFTEVLAHELAHLILGVRDCDDHDKKWQNLFDEIYDRWEKKMMPFYEKDEQQEENK